MDSATQKADLGRISLAAIAACIPLAAAAACTPLVQDIPETGDAGATETGSVSSTAVSSTAVFTSVVWGDDAVDSTAMGLFPTLAAGPSGDGGSWMIQVQTRYGDPNDAIDSQIGPIGGALAPPTMITGGTPPPALTTLTLEGDPFVVYPAGGSMTLWYFAGIANAAQESLSWPAGDVVGSGEVAYRPRVTRTTLDTELGPTVVEVHMASATAGALRYATDGFNGWAGFVTYDLGPSQNPAVAATPAIDEAAYVIEVHQDATTDLEYRVLPLPPPTASSWGPTTPLDGEQGQHPAVAVCGATVIEVHEGLAGDLRYILGSIDHGTVTWRIPSQPYEAAGADPAIALDPSTCRGIEAHDSAARDGTIVEKPFVLH